MRPDLRQSLSMLLDQTTGWYRRWYFLLRLDAEIEQARRHDRPTSVIAVKIPLASTGLVTLLSDRLRQRLARIANEALRPADFPGCLHEDELAIYLPNTDRDEAERLLEKLKAELEAFTPRLGIATFPQDGRNALELLVVATEYEATPLSPVIDLDDYRRRRALAVAK